MQQSYSHVHKQTDMEQTAGNCLNTDQEQRGSAPTEFIKKMVWGVGGWGDGTPDLWLELQSLQTFPDRHKAHRKRLECNLKLIS